MPVSTLASVGSSPTAAAYARLNEVYPQLRITIEAPRSGPGWVTSTELAAGGPALDAYLEQDEVQLLRDYGQHPRPEVVASFGLHRYAWRACLLVTAPYFLLRRVPRIPAAGVSFHHGHGRMTVHSQQFACLPDDPAAALPGAQVVPDGEALRAQVRDAVAEHLGPVLDGFRPRLRRGRRALWAMATDEIVGSLLYLGSLLDDEERATTEAGRLLPGATTPYTGRASFRELTGPAGEKVTVRQRVSCCLLYTLRPEAPCVTCPRTCNANRVERATS